MNVALCRYANEWPNVPVTFTLERNPMTSQLYQKVVALELLLRQHEESNRIRGVTATREALDQGDLEGAKTTYRAMASDCISRRLYEAEVTTPTSFSPS